MKNERQPEDSLRALLHEWRVEPTLPPRFPEQVWRSIQAQEGRGATWWTVFCQWLETSLARPALAVAYVAVLVTVGLALGFHQGQSHSSRAEAELAARYVQSIDPYHKTAHGE